MGISGHLADFSDQRRLTLDHTSDTGVDASVLLALGLLITQTGSDRPSIPCRW